MLILGRGALEGGWSGCVVRSMCREWGALLAPTAVRMSWWIPHARSFGAPWRRVEHSGGASRTQDSMCFPPLGLVYPDQNLRTCFLCPVLARELFLSSNQCHGFVHWRNGASHGSWQAAMDGRVGSGALLGLLCDLGQTVYLWKSRSDVGEWCTTQK